MAAGAASADLSFSGFVILAVLLVVLWTCYGLLRVVIAHNQRRLGRRQEAQERLWRVLHPLLGGGGARQVLQPCMPGSRAPSREALNPTERIIEAPTPVLQLPPQMTLNLVHCPGWPEPAGAAPLSVPCVRCGPG